MAITSESRATEEKHRLKTGDEYRESLRDNRDVRYMGERIDDVTTHFATSGGIDTVAELYDLQFDPEARNILTRVREDGTRVTASCLIPRTKEDLAFRREGIKFVARKSWGTHGRGIDMIATLPIGMYANLPTFRKYSPEFADHIAPYIEHLEEENIHLAETIVDPQGYRARASGTPADVMPPERAAARIVKENDKGIWISGIKGVGTACPQANELILGSFHPPLDEESFWVYIPADAEGIRMFCREVTHRPGSSAYDHPLTSHGEEIEALVAFENLFVPREQVVALRKRELHTVNFYNTWARWEHWYTFVRIVAKSEMYAGLAQLIIDSLELEEIPVVRQRVADILEFSLILQGMQLAAEETAFLSENGVMTPNNTIVTAGRSYAQHNLPTILHILQDICGQGLILRFNEADLETPAAFGKNLSWFLDTRQITAKEKNLIMNLVWDVAASEHATRSKIFEESNALNVPFLKERLYGEWDRSELLQEARAFIGLAPAPERKFAPRIEAPSISIQEEAKRTLDLEMTETKS